MRSALCLSIAFLTACASPLARKTETIEPETSVSLENGSFTLALDGRRIHYEVHGQGPVLMTVPNSWGLSLPGLRGIYAPLEKHVTMVYFDPRGMGASSPVEQEADRGPAAVREDFEALREHLALDRVNAIGWSNGATNLILLASEHPEVFSTAIFLHGNASFLPEDAAAMGARYPELFEAFGVFEKQMAATELSADEQNARVKDFDLEVWFPVMFADREAARAKLDEAFGEAEFSWEHARHTQKEWPSVDFRDELAEIRARSLVIAGSHDVLPTDKAVEIEEGIPGAAFVVFEASGHFAPLEEPEKFLETVLEFLDNDVSPAEDGG